MPGFNLLMYRAVLNQLNGLTELIRDDILISAGTCPFSNWVFPGNKKRGY